MSNYIGDSPKLLVVEDNKTIIEGLKYLLKKEGFKAIIVNTKKEAEHYINTEQSDLFFCLFCFWGYLVFVELFLFLYYCI